MISTEKGEQIIFDNMKIQLGGSPCTHWSIAQTKNRETEPNGLGWELFKNYLIALKKFKPDFFLYENNKCGFGENHYRFDNGGVATATQVISENSSMFRTIKKNEVILHNVLEELVRIILRLGNSVLHLGLNEDVEISIDFDDSIIEDKAQNEARIYQMLNAGLMRADEARAILMNEDIETARAALPTMDDMVTSEQDEVE